MGVLIEKAHLHLSLWTAERLGPDLGLEKNLKFNEPKVKFREVIQGKEEQVGAIGPDLRALLMQ